MASEWLVQRAIDHPYDRHGFPTEWLVIAQTLSDARNISIEGASGVIRIVERRGIPHRYVRHPKPCVIFTETGTKIFFLGADSPDVGRGYNAAGAVLDEVCKWKRSKESWYEGIMPSLRADLVGDHPRTLVTTTPKPIELLREWVAQTDGSVKVVRGSTFDNKANLSQFTLDELERRYAGTSIGRQELYGELLDGRDGCLWAWSDIDDYRITREELDTQVEFSHLTVGVDPTLTDEGDEMGVVVVGRDFKNNMYVLADESIRGSGRPAARHIWQVFYKWGADSVVIEENNAKRWMTDVLTDAYAEARDQDKLFPEKTAPPLKRVDSRVGKQLRAQPVAMRYEQGTVHHVGQFKDLEEEMLNFDPTDSHNSPNRMDALVHACRHLMAGEKRRVRISSTDKLWIPVG
jgi:phage terminase large subunit-like protein